MSKKEDPKGIYRAIYTSIWDDPDFLKLSCAEKLVLLNFRTSPLSNMICVFPYYLEAIEKQTGLSRRAILKAIDTLCHTLWITVSDGLCWIRNGLKYDPNISLKNPKHLDAIRKIILSLPKIKLVFDFCDYYKIDIPYPIPYTIPYRPAYANQEPEPEPDKEKEKDCVQETPPDSLSPTVWENFIKHRKRKRAPMTEEATRLIFLDLKKWELEFNWKPDDVVNQSIKQGWTGIFELKENHQNSEGELTRWLREHKDEDPNGSIHAD